MARPRKKEYHTGDQLHFIITEDFVETANAFFDHCDARMLNASSVIRRAMEEWLERATGRDEAERGRDGIHEMRKSGKVDIAGTIPVLQQPGRPDFGAPIVHPSEIEKQRMIEQMFLIYKDGALLAHATSHVTPDLDMDIFSSMLTLIQGFVTESFSDMKDTHISMIEFGEKNILIEPSLNLDITLAIVYSGDDHREEVESIAQAIHFEMEFTFGKKLKNFDGNLDKIRGIRDIMINHI